MHTNILCTYIYGIYEGRAEALWRVTVAERLVTKPLNLHTNQDTAPRAKCSFVFTLPGLPLNLYTYQTKRAGSLPCHASAAAPGKGGNDAGDAARAGARGWGSTAV